MDNSGSGWQEHREVKARLLGFKNGNKSLRVTNLNQTLLAPFQINATSSRGWGASNPRRATLRLKMQTPRRRWRAKPPRHRGARRPTWFSRRWVQRRAPLRSTPCYSSTHRGSPRRSWCARCSSGWRWTAATATSPTLNVTCHDMGGCGRWKGRGLWSFYMWLKEAFIQSRSSEESTCCCCERRYEWAATDSVLTYFFCCCCWLDQTWIEPKNPPLRRPKRSDPVHVSVIIWVKAAASLKRSVSSWRSAFSGLICLLSRWALALCGWTYKAKQEIISDIAWNCIAPANESQPRPLMLFLRAKIFSSYPGGYY